MTTLNFWKAVEKMSDAKLDKAIEVLKEQYEKAKKLEWIFNPLTYALYQTWKIFDKRGAK